MLWAVFHGFVLGGLSLVSGLADLSSGLVRF